MSISWTGRAVGAGYRIARPLLFALDAERAHAVGMRTLTAIDGTPLAAAAARALAVDDPILHTELCGMQLRSPVGLAAGFDKNARAPAVFGALGFGFVEVGGVTQTPQAGNPRPRLFRLREDRAIINRLGLNNDGAAAIARRLAAADAAVPIGANIALSDEADPAAAPADYAATYTQLAPHVAYVTVNVSCPNRPEHTALQDPDRLAAIIDAVTAAGQTPVFVKLSPDLSAAGVRAAVELAEAGGVAAVVASNTTTDRSMPLAGPHHAEPGGLSGRPLQAAATAQVRQIAAETTLPVIGVGGVATGADAYEKIRAGASAVQLYTAMVYRGPTVAAEIATELAALLRADGYASVSEAVGADL